MSRNILRAPWFLDSCLHLQTPLFPKKFYTSHAPACKQRESSDSGQPSSSSTVDKEDVARHTALLNEWWDPQGPMKALHSYNLLRVPFIRDGLVDCGEEKKSLYPLKGLKILDVGCGGGILSEPLAILGASVTGLDASCELISLAKEHSKISGLNKKLSENMLNYVCSSIEEHAVANKECYNAVVASEIIEHVNNKALFVNSCINTLKTGGRIFFTTPNRTQLSNLFVINIAENVMKVVPKGTHQIEKFTTPTELSFLLERSGCHVELIHGMFYSIINNKWYWTKYQHLIFALQAVKTDDVPRSIYTPCDRMGDFQKPSK